MLQSPESEAAHRGTTWRGMKRTTKISRISKRQTKSSSKAPLAIAASAAFTIFTISMVVIALLASAGVGAYRYYQSVVPDGVQALINYEQQPYQVSTVEDRQGHVLQDLVNPSLGIRQIIPLTQIPKNLINATIDTENRTFYNDPGIDPVRLFKASLHDVNGGGLQGGSTLTQQLVKLGVFGSLAGTTRKLDQTNVQRKLQEIFIAVGATQHLKKDGILEMYLNTIPYGNFTFGAEAAANYYFGRHASQLDLAECALLAGLPQAPSQYDPVHHRSLAVRRQHIVLQGMLDQGHISRADYDVAVAEPLEFVFQNPVVHNAYKTIESYFVDWLINTYLQDPANLQAFNLPDLRVPHDVYRGFVFRTTLDPSWQNLAQGIVQSQVANQGYLNMKDGALVAIDPRSNEIKAMVGGIGFNAPIDGAQYNMAWQTRQPGSSFKPFMYATAFEHGHFPAESIDDSYVSFPAGDGSAPYVPKNYDLGYHGLVTIRQALANSYNVPAVKTLNNLIPAGGDISKNIQEVLNTANRMGYHLKVQDPKKSGLAFALGTDEGRLLEEVNAYTVFANNGTYRPYMPIMAIYRRLSGGGLKQIWQYHTPQGVQVLAPQFAYQITSILSDTAAKVPAFGQAAFDLLGLPDRPLAAKTGTTSDFKDNLTLGYTPNLTVGVWVGNPDNTPMYNSTGITGAAPIFHEFVQKISATLPPMQFIMPTGIITATVARYAPLNGLPGISASGVTDIFAAGTVPNSYDQPSQDVVNGKPGQATDASGNPSTGTDPAATGGAAACHGGRYTYQTVIVKGKTQYQFTCV